MTNKFFKGCLSGKRLNHENLDRKSMESVSEDDYQVDNIVLEESPALSSEKFWPMMS